MLEMPSEHFTYASNIFDSIFVIYAAAYAMCNLPEIYDSFLIRICNFWFGSNFVVSEHIWGIHELFFCS